MAEGLSRIIDRRRDLRRLHGVSVAQRSPDISHRTVVEGAGAMTWTGEIPFSAD